MYTYTYIRHIIYIYIHECTQIHTPYEWNTSHVCGGLLTHTSIHTSCDTHIHPYVMWHTHTHVTAHISTSNDSFQAIHHHLAYTLVRHTDTHTHTYTHAYTHTHTRTHTRKPIPRAHTPTSIHFTHGHTHTKLTAGAKHVRCSNFFFFADTPTNAITHNQTHARESGDIVWDLSH